MPIYLGNLSNLLFCVFAKFFFKMKNFIWTIFEKISFSSIDSAQRWTHLNVFVSHLFNFWSVIPLHFIYFLLSEMTGFYSFCIYFFHSYVKQNCILSLVSVIKYATSRFTYITRATFVNQVGFARFDVKATCCKCRQLRLMNVKNPMFCIFVLCRCLEV